MSSVEILKIQGIRSFGPDSQDEAIIEFSSPLTLILGQNGCGKTTIIEALKYAVCGELPSGTDSGSGFVHDPKLADMIEVKGNVKLKCRDVKGNAITVSRTVRVQQKAKKLEFKSVDATFTKGEGTNKQDTFSGKCSDIDGTMCEALGTSQAVLTSVIFCHQEDSLWPLDKGKKIKDKFDAIFGITEYNKCLDYFRATSKELDQKKALLKKDVECSQKFWEETKEKRKKLENLKAKSAAQRDEIEQMNTEIQPIRDQIKEIVYKETNYAQHMAELKGKNDRRKLIVETIDDLKKEIRDEFLGSREELMNEIRNFVERLEETTSKIEDMNCEKTNLLAEETRLQKDITHRSMIMGQLQSDENQQRERIDTRNQRLRNLGNELEVNVISNSQLNDSSSEDTLREIENKIQTRRVELKNQQDEQLRFENQIQNKIDTTREKRAALRQDDVTKRKAIDVNKREIEKIETEIAEVDKSGDKLATLESNLKEVEKELNEAVASLDADQCKAEIERTNEDVKKFEKKLVTVNEEVRQLQEINVEKANLAKLIERQKNLEEELQALEGKHSGSLQHLLTSIPEYNIKPKLQARINELNEEVRTHESAINELERKLSVLKEKKRNVEEQIKQKKKKMFQDQDNIDSVCGEKDIESYYADILDKLQEANSAKGTVQASSLMFKKYLEKLQSKDHICPLCLREFSNVADYEEIVENLQGKIKSHPESLERIESDIKKYTEEQTKVSRLLPLNDSIKKVDKIEIPKLESDLKRIVKEAEEVESQLKSHQDNLVGPQTDREIASKILPDVVLMDQRKEEVRKLKDDIKNLEDKLPSFASGKTLEEANAEQDKLRSDIESLRKKITIEQNRLSSYSDRVSKLRERKSNLTAQQLKIVGGVQKRKALTERLEELNLMVTTLKKELEQVKAQLQPIDEELEQEQKTLSTMRAKHRLMLEEKQKQINDIEKKVEDIRTLQSEITDYVKGGGSKHLMDIKKEFEEKGRRKDELEGRKIQIEKELEKLKKFQNNHELQKRDLDANLKLRIRNEELVKVEEEIKELDGQVKVLNFDQLRRERSQKEKKLRDLEHRKSNAEGQLQVVASTLKDVERELNKPAHKEAEDEYRKSVVKLTVVGKSVEDLKLYEKAMDWAMIHFHKERMKMINDIVRDLWRHIYKGNDIDYIEIRTDEGTSTAGGRRTYNYKVVQVKSGIEIDMPGRCSAGQKVLACLIIRMALAETFCKNCGILALDEPTTNLDRDNIESLSEALAAIVERRSAQRKFQLLVITHDEEFLRRLFRVDRVESYLEVKRDGRGRSQVILRKELM